MSSKGSHSGLPEHLWVQESGPEGAVVVVLIHGSLDRSSGMAKVARLIPDLRTIRFDRRGYAKSIGHPGPYCVPGNVDDVEAILAGRRAILVGHSYGGNVALAAAARFPSQVMGVSTYESPLSWQEWWPSNTAGAAGATADPSKAAEDFMVRLIGRRRWDDLPESTRVQRRREGPTLKAELADLRSHQPWRPEDIGCRVIAAHGSAGADHHRRGATWIAEHVDSGELAVIDGAGHGAPISHPGDFVAKLVRPHLEGRSTLNVTS